MKQREGKEGVRDSRATAGPANGPDQGQRQDGQCGGVSVHGQATVVAGGTIQCQQDKLGHGNPMIVVLLPEGGKGNRRSSRKEGNELPLVHPQHITAVRGDEPQGCDRRGQPDTPDEESGPGGGGAGNGSGYPWLLGSLLHGLPLRWLTAGAVLFKHTMMRCITVGCKAIWRFKTDLSGTRGTRDIAGSPSQKTCNVPILLA